jgi:hypothetical protein
MIESRVGNLFRAQGELRASRARLLELLRAKYPGSVSAEVVQMVEQQGDLALLQTWFTSALRERSFDDFVKSFK